MSRVILYYPHIQIPTSGAWIRKALLYWDKLGAIVPESHRGQMNTEILQQYSPEIECLYKDGIFKPFNPDMVLENHDALTLFSDELMDALFPDPQPIEKIRRNSHRCDVSIYPEKATYRIFRMLEEEGLALRCEETGMYLFERTTANVYMALLAKHLALVSPEVVVPGSDCAAETALMFGSTQAKAPQNLVLSTQLDSLIPTPRTDVPLREILKFRDKYQSSLLAFRAAIDQLERELRECTDQCELKSKLQAHKEKIATETMNLQKALTANSIASWLGSVEAFFKPSSPAILAASYALAKHADSIASVPVTVLAAGTAGVGTIGVGMHWFNKAQERRLTIEKSPFAYLLLAKKELT